MNKYVYNFCAFWWRRDVFVAVAITNIVTSGTYVKQRKKNLAVDFQADRDVNSLIYRDRAAHNAALNAVLKGAPDAKVVSTVSGTYRMRRFFLTWFCLDKADHESNRMIHHSPWILLLLAPTDSPLISPLPIITIYLRLPRFFLHVSTPLLFSALLPSPLDDNIFLRLLSSGKENSSRNRLPYWSSFEVLDIVEVMEVWYLIM